MQLAADLVGLAIVTSLCLVAAITDYRTGKIFNWLTLPPLVVAPIAHSLLGGMQAAVASILGILGCGLVPFLLFKARIPTEGQELHAGGGGDVKLLAAIGGIVGLKAGLEIGIATLFATGIYGLGKLAVEGKLLQTFKNVFIILTNPFLPKKRKRTIKRESLSRIRIGPAFLAGSVAVLLYRHPEILGLR